MKSSYASVAMPPSASASSESIPLPPSFMVICSLNHTDGDILYTVHELTCQAPTEKNHNAVRDNILNWLKKKRKMR